MTVNLQGSDLNIDNLNLDFDQSFVCIQVTNPTDAENGQGLYTNWTLCCDGNYSFSGDCSLGTTEFFAEKINVFPNPASDFVFIKSPYEIEAVEIFTLNGEKLQNAFSEANRIDMRSLVSGIYFIKLSGENGSQVVKKIVKK
ncbi:MAG TPA: T9SS type A sorting domain-containing protein [Flavobacteriaceae bacterium]|nr:T9SS type A sorting domain-containing protein [Flavobacteriaceae bacterium]